MCTNDDKEFVNSIIQSILATGGMYKRQKRNHMSL